MYLTILYMQIIIANKRNEYTLKFPLETANTRILGKQETANGENIYVN